MPNNENIDKVIASIKGEIEATKIIGFNMAEFIDGYESDQSERGCGTTACIAGHAAMLSADFKFSTEDSEADVSGEFLDAMLGSEGRSKGASLIDAFVKTGAKFLGLHSRAASSLFYPKIDGGERLDEITSEEAIEVLENLKKTGKVDWSIIPGCL